MNPPKIGGRKWFECTRCGLIKAFFLIVSSSMSSLPPIQQFKSSTGARIYRIPVEAFPGFIAYCYVLLEAGVPTLIDTGSGLGNSTDHLMRGIAAVRDEFGEALELRDIKRILITHGHIDHFGGVAFVQEQTGAQIGIHELDRRVLVAYEERVVIATKGLRVYLERAGGRDETRQRMMEMYGFAKKTFRSVNVDFSLHENRSEERRVGIGGSI